MKVKIKNPPPDDPCPDFAYTVIRQTEDTITVGWSTRGGLNWNERTLKRDEVVEVEDE